MRDLTTMELLNMERESLLARKRAERAAQQQASAPVEAVEVSFIELDAPGLPELLKRELGYAAVELLRALVELADNPRPTYREHMVLVDEGARVARELVATYDRVEEAQRRAA